MMTGTLFGRLTPRDAETSGPPSRILEPLAHRISPRASMMVDAPGELLTSDSVDADPFGVMSGKLKMTMLFSLRVFHVFEL